MATLRDFRTYLDQREEALAGAEETLCVLQAKFEQFYAEVARVREQEIQQLRAHILKNRAELTKAFTDALAAAEAEAARDLETQLGSLGKQLAALHQEAESQRQASVSAELDVRKNNAELDEQEEKLKARSEKLLAEITEYNRRISELGRGFGFFKNLFAMRRLQAERAELDTSQADLAARIDQIRARWDKIEGVFGDAEQRRKNRWVELQTEAARIKAKIEHLENTKSRLIERSALEKVLLSREPNIAKASTKDPRCPQCNQNNAPEVHFCRICAHRLKADRPDFEGSLLEVAELNYHFETFSEGMRACQEIIGLVRGLKSGIVNFTESVSDMIETEQKHPVSKLRISVPSAAVAYGRNFERIRELAEQNRGLHPKDFAAHMSSVMKTTYTEDSIENYFETMGEELSKMAEQQW